MEAAVATGQLKVFQLTIAQGLVEGEHHLPVFHFVAHDLGEEVHLLAPNQPVEAEADALGHLLLSQRVDVLRLS